MSLVRFVDPPEPPADAEHGWCTMCLMLAKTRIGKQNFDAINAAVNDGHGRDKVAWIPWDKSIELFPGWYYAVSDWPALGLLWLCWTHVAGMQVERVSPLLGADGMPPGLIRGQG